jgi:hypothetical protein
MSASSPLVHRPRPRVGVAIRPSKALNSCNPAGTSTPSRFGRNDLRASVHNMCSPRSCEMLSPLMSFESHLCGCWESCCRGLRKMCGFLLCTCMVEPLCRLRTVVTKRGRRTILSNECANNGCSTRRCVRVGACGENTKAKGLYPHKLCLPNSSPHHSIARIIHTQDTFMVRVFESQRYCRNLCAICLHVASVGLLC